MCCRGQMLTQPYAHFTQYHKARTFSLSFHWTNDTSKAWLSSSRLGMNSSQINQGKVWLFLTSYHQKKPQGILKYGWKQTGLDHMWLRKLLISSEKLLPCHTKNFPFLSIFFKFNFLKINESNCNIQERLTACEKTECLQVHILIKWQNKSKSKHLSVWLLPHHLVVAPCLIFPISSMQVLLGGSTVTVW